ncbi:HNH endonuclease [Vibrio vulnificus]|nr:HNH endonuclease [Vibrio vulnificus]
MVAKLVPPPYDSTLVVRNVIRERVHHRDFYASIQGDWIAQVLSYIENSGSPELIAPLNLRPYITVQNIEEESRREPRRGESEDPTQRLLDRRKKSLIGLYSPASDKQPYEILEALRRKHRLLFCPSCGEPGKPGTLDHYLPKTVYPELSIVVLNLTPMCSECQGRKGSDITDEYGNKIFIHPYFDPVEEVLLELQILEPYSTPAAFTVGVPDDIDEPLRSLVERHIEGIDFVDRFEEFCRIEYTNLLMTFSDEREQPEPSTSKQIISRFLRQYERQSVNRWESIFYRGILANQNLLNYLDEGELPEFL